MDPRQYALLQQWFVSQYMDQSENGSQRQPALVVKDKWFYGDL